MLHGAKPRPISRTTAIAFGTALTALLLIAMFPIFPRQFNIHVGDVASRTVKSPRTVSFESSFLTQQRQNEAANAVRPSLVFDSNVRTTQIARYDKAAEQATQIIRTSTGVA